MFLESSKWVWTAGAALATSSKSFAHEVLLHEALALLLEAAWLP